MPVLSDFSRRRGITLPLLSDAGSATIKAYGLLNTTVAATNALQYGIPFPGTIIVDQRGIVTSRVFESPFQERDTMASVLVHLGATLDLPATRVTAPHVTLTTFATDQVAAVGTHFSLVVDVAPDARVHVYAPGVSGYKPIALRVVSQPWLIVRPAHYPKPSDFFFRPLKEHVAVFDRPFRIVQEVTIDASREAEAALKEQSQMVITASLDYQACDDRVCFNPQSIQLSWTVQLRTLDRERMKQQ